MTWVKVFDFVKTLNMQLYQVFLKVIDKVTLYITTELTSTEIPIILST